MIALGQKETPLLEKNLCSFTPNIQQVYLYSKEGNSQRWLMIELKSDSKEHADVKRLIDLRAHLRKKHSNKN